MPITGGEIAVGESLLRAEGAHIGSSLRVGDGASARALRIVGTVVVPGLGLYPGADAPTLGGSAVVTLDEFRVLVPRGADPYAVIRFASPVAPQMQAGVVAAAVGRKPGEIALSGLRHNVDTTSLAAVRRTPVLLAAALAVLTTATMTQALFAATRRRRPTLEVLAALGADRRSIHWFVVGHAVMVVAAAILTGTAVGVFLGRRVWGTVARSTGVAAGHVVPVRQLLAAAAVAVVIGVAASWLPARHAIHPELGTAPRAE